MEPRRNILISVVVPAFNEERTVAEILCRVLENHYKKEIIVVDDGSTDQTAAEVRRVNDSSIRLILHGENRGKGAALSTGFKEAKGDIVIVQDADLEYDPECYKSLVRPIRIGLADVVYGSRFLGTPHRVQSLWQYFANKLLTFWSNIWCNRNFSDMETGYKVFKREVLDDIEIKEKRFGIEPEITQKVVRRGWRIVEVPITYYGRTYGEGKKIGAKDALHAFWCVVRYALKD